GAFEEIAELPFVQTVHEAKLLFFLQLKAVAAQLAALSRTVLSRGIRPFQLLAGPAQGNAQAPAEFEARSRIPCHFALLLLCENANNARHRRPEGGSTRG